MSYSFKVSFKNGGEVINISGDVPSNVEWIISGHSTSGPYAYESVGVSQVDSETARAILGASATKAVQ